MSPRLQVTTKKALAYHRLNHPITEIQHQDKESNLFARNFEPNQKVEADEHKHRVEYMKRLVGK